MQTRNPIYRDLTVAILLALLLGSSLVIAAPVLSKVEELVAPVDAPGLPGSSAHTDDVALSDETPLLEVPQNASVLNQDMRELDAQATSRPANTAENMELIGHFGGDIRAVAVQGDYAYVTEYDYGLRVLDISDATNPMPVGIDADWSYWIDKVDMIVAEDYVYLATHQGLDGEFIIEDISDPEHPTAVYRYDLYPAPGMFQGVALVEDYAYVADFYWGLYVFSVSTHITQTGYYWGGPGTAGFTDVTVAEGYAYVTDSINECLRVFDVTDPITDPIPITTLENIGPAESVAVAGDYAYVAGNSLRVVDISTPSSPNEMNSYPLGGSHVAVAGDYAYVAGYGGLRVVDVSAPDNLREVGYYDMPEEARHVAVSGGYIYVADGDGGLFILRHTEADGSGKVTTPIGSGDDHGQAMAVQTDGKIVVAGYAHNGTDDFAVVRYNTDGSLDTAFGSSGKVTTDFGYDDQGLGLAIQTDGKIVVVGHSGTAGTYYGVWAIARYNSDGSLDAGFGTGGQVTTDIGSSHDWPSSVVIQGDGRIVVGGSEDDKIPTDFALARYHGDGSLDTSFGVDGIVDTPIGTGYDEGKGDVILQPDGKIILTGWSEVSYDQKDFALVRYNSDGSLDTTFGTGGKVTTDLGTKADYAWAAALQTDGKIVLAGYTYTGNSAYDIAMARYNSDGSLDTTFGSNGIVVTDLGSASESALGVALQTNGKIVLAGYSGGDLMVLRYNSDGSLDTTFGSGGYVTTDFGNGEDSGNAVALQTDGKIVVAGYANNGSDDDFALVRYNVDGSLDTSFGGAPGPTALPLILVHGFQGFPGSEPHSCQDHWIDHYGDPDVFDNTFGNMKEWFETAGYDVWVAHLDTSLAYTPPIEVNAQCLKEQIAHVRSQTGQKVTLVAHSMGGLVSRACLSNSDCRENVKALYTLGSPHAGSNGLSILLPALFPDINNVCVRQPAFCQFSSIYMAWFNLFNPNRDLDYYFIGGDGKDAFLYWLLLLPDGPNDGLVGKNSAVGWSWPTKRDAVWGSLAGRYWTDETHTGSDLVGHPSYFEASGGDDSQAFRCIESLLDNLDPDDCTPATKGTNLALDAAQAEPNLSAITVDVTGHLASGQSVSHTLQIDTSKHSLFYLSWLTGTLSFTLTQPNGQVITPAYADTHPDIVTYTMGVGDNALVPFAAYAFTTTLPGTYTMTIKAENMDGGGTVHLATAYLAFAALETDRTFSIATNADLVQVGDTAIFTGTLQGSSGGLTGADVQVRLARMDGVTETLALTASGTGTLVSGTYRATYTIPDVPGYLRATFTAIGDDAGTAFTRQAEKLLAIAPHAAQLTGAYADRSEDKDGDGFDDTLALDMGVTATQAGTYTLSADLVAAGQAIAHATDYVILAGDTQTITLRFDGWDIRQSRVDGPYTVTHVYLVDLGVGGIPAQVADEVWGTAAYEWQDFGFDSLYLPITLKGH